MRIAFVSLMTGSPWAASELLWAETAETALRSGHEVFVSVLHWSDRPQAIEQLARDGARIHMRPIRRWLRRSAALSSLTGVFDPLIHFKPDVVCVNQGGTYDIARGGATAVLRRILSRLTLPYVLLCHCEQPAPSRRKLKTAQEAFARAHTVGVLAEKLKRLSESHLGRALPNAAVFHNPVNLRSIEYLPWPMEQSPLRLACVGRLEPHKNLESLIDILATATWTTRDWMLTVHGTGSLRESLEARVRAALLESRIRFVGHAADIGVVWSQHHALVMPSHFEGVPLAMVEAMLCGRPVVAADVGGISEWIEHGRTGFLIRGPNPQDVGDALEQLWIRRRDLEFIGTEAYRRTLEKRDKDPAGTLLRWLKVASAGRPILSASVP